MRLLIFSVLILSHSLWATVCSPTQTNRIRAQLEDIVSEYLPELGEVLENIELREIENDQYTYFRTWFEPVSLFKNSRKYQLYANCAAFDDPPISDNALYSILIHELIHIRDYHLATRLELIDLALQYVLAGPVMYERDTDLQTLEVAAKKENPYYHFKKIATDLKKFRLWVYGRMKTAQQLKDKLASYLSADELANIQDSYLELQKSRMRYTFRDYLNQQKLQYLLGGPKTRVAFFEVTNSRGKLVQYEPTTRFAHMAIEINGKWLHAHPTRGVEYITDFNQIGFYKYTVYYKYIPEAMISAKVAQQLLNRPYDEIFDWDDNKIYCSELVAKILSISPKPMSQKYGRRLGISPDDLYDAL